MKKIIDSYRHEADTRKNAVPVGLASYDTSNPKPKKYDYAPHFAFMIAELFTNVIIIQEFKYEGDH